MYETHVANLRKMAGRTTPPNDFFLDVANALSRLEKVEAAAFDAYDCLGGEEEMREILAKALDI